MNKSYFLKLLKNYCNNEHKNNLCSECRLLVDEFDNNTIDHSMYYKIIAYSSYLFRRFHYYTYTRCSKLNSDDLTKN